MELLAVWGLGIAIGAWFGWLKWRQPELTYQNDDIGIDAALGLRELPPIRVNVDVAERLQREAESAGVIVQAHVRELLSKGRRGHIPPRPMPARSETPNGANERRSPLDWWG